MSGKVIHMDTGIHGQIKAYCDRHKIRMSLWAGHVLLEAIKEPPKDYQAEAPPAPARPVVKPVDPPARLRSVPREERAGSLRDKIEQAGTTCTPIAVVPKRPLPEMDDTVDEELYSRPPFWTKRQSG